MITPKNHAGNEIKDLRWNPIDALTAGPTWRSLGACIAAVAIRGSAVRSIRRPGR
jgi:hypothetical protein